MYTNFTLFSLILCLSTLAQAKMKALDDEVLSGVSGQTGFTLDLEANIRAEEFAYFDDGKGLALQGLHLSSAVDSSQNAEFRFKADILNDGSMLFEYKSGNVARLEVADIRFVDTPGATKLATDASIGGLYFDFDIDGTLAIQNRGNSGTGVNNAAGGVYDINFSIADGRLGYRTNGNELFLDGLSLDVSSNNTILGVTPDGQLNLSLPSFLAELKVDALRFSNNPLNHGVSNDVDTGIALPSYGSLWANIVLNSDLLLRAGGAQGLEGFTINSTTAINRLDLAWGDDTDWVATGSWLGALDITGTVDLVNLTVDVLDDPDSGVTPAKDYGVGLALAFERLTANFHVKDFVLGETKSNIDAYVLNNLTPIKSIGSLDINLQFEDGSYNSVARTNQVYLQAGGNADAGNQGLRLDTELSLVSPENQSNLVYTDDGQSIMLSSLKGFADGDLTLDITSDGDINGTTFYDGLRVGFEDMAFGYSVEGYRVAKNTGDNKDLKSAELQAAQAIPGIGFSPSVEGVLNGHITLGAGGRIGSEGVTVNSDLEISDGSMAQFIQADGTGKGLWLSGLNYDVHLRDMMLDVTEDGLQIYETEKWSKLDVTDFRVGDKVSGASFGRLVLEHYELGTERSISAGGAGEVCIGGVGADSATCTADNGRWEDRGSQGLTVKAKRHFQNSIEAENKRNRFTWETGRVGEGTATPTNGTGMQLVFDNFTTNDGDGLTDDFGIQTEYNIDVARTVVLKKSDGADSNGVVGNKGWEKIMLADGSYEYKDPSTLTAADIANRPVGLALRTNTQFKELDFGSVNLIHQTGGAETLLYGLKLQNFNITTDITSTPLD